MFDNIRQVTKIPVMKETDEVTFISFITIGAYFTILFGIWWFWPSSIPHNFTGMYHILDYLLFLAISYVVWHQIILELFSWFIASNMRRPMFLPPEKGLNVAFLTAFVPQNEPIEILENTLQAMIAVEYPHHTWVLDEGNSDEVKKVCDKYGVKHFSRKGIPEYNQSAGRYKTKTKGGNYNAWFDNYGIDYDLVAQIDVDFIPKKNFLTDTIGYFRDPDVAFVGTPQVYGNQEASWIARGAAEQAFSFYGHMQKGFCGYDMSLFIGANHIVRSLAHHDIDGYAGHIVEDHLTGMNIYKKKWKSVYVPKILAIGEGPATWDAYFSQQMRWSYGLIHILFNESFKQFKRMKAIHVFNYFILQQHYFYGLAQFIGIVLLALYFVFGIQATNLLLGPFIYLYIPVLIMQHVIAFWLQKYTVDPVHESGWLLKGKLLSIAAWPIYLLAFFSVVTGKRLTYKVTPKGNDNQSPATSLKLFIPHFILGSITALGILFGIYFHHTAPQLIFFAVLNTIGMYAFVVMVLKEKIARYMAHVNFSFLRLSLLSYNTDHRV